MKKCFAFGLFIIATGALAQPPREALIWAWPAAGIVRVSEFVKTDMWRLQVQNELILQQQDPENRHFIYFRESRTMFTFSEVGNGPERILDCMEGFYNPELGYLYTNAFRAMIFGVTPGGQFIANTNGVIETPLSYNFRLGVGSIADVSEYSKTVFQSTLTLVMLNRTDKVMFCDFWVRYLTKETEKTGEYRDLAMVRACRPGWSFWNLSLEKANEYLRDELGSSDKVKYFFLPSFQPSNIREPLIEN